MELLKNSSFYFGTDKSSYEEIQKNGLTSIYSRTRNFDAWLGDRGIYLSLRPVVAYHFAKQKAYRNIYEETILVETKLDFSKINNTQILDLTSETGMYKLWVSMIQKNDDLFGNPYLKAINTTVSKKNSNSYFNSITNTLNQYKKTMNLDCVAVTNIIINQGVNIVIGIFQEGDSFAKSITGISAKKYKNIPSYKGILSRDHVEICVVNLNLVTISKVISKIDLMDLIKDGDEISKTKYLEFITSSIGHKSDFN